MISQRIKTIASLVTSNTKVIDIGTDHAYLPIYLINNLGFENCDCADISPEVLKQARTNLEKNHLLEKVKIILSDGFTNVDSCYDVAVIAGMGAVNIIKILKEAPSIPPEIIIASNTHNELVRKYLNEIGYKIVKEVVIYEKGKYYNIIKYQKGKEKITWEEINFGKHNNKEYLIYLLNKRKLEYEKNKDENTRKLIIKLTHFIERIPD